MKKLTILLAVFITIAISCKKDSKKPDSDPPVGPGVVAPPEAERNAIPMNLVMNSESGKSETITITYLSASKKIDRITTQNGSVEIYHYSGDLIDKIDYGTNGTDYSKFEYQNNDLIRETHYRASKAMAKKEYTYPSSRKIQVIEFDYRNDKWELHDAAINFEFDDKGNLIKGESGNIKVSVLYDTNNAPFLNVVGWSKINYAGGIPMGNNINYMDIIARRNNPTKVTATDAGISSMDLAYTYEFNDTKNLKFPTKITGSGDRPFSMTVVYK